MGEGAGNPQWDPQRKGHKKRMPPLKTMSRETEQQEEWAVVAPCWIDEKRQVDEGISVR